MPPVVSTSNDPASASSTIASAMSGLSSETTRLDYVEPLLAKKLLERVAARVLAHARSDAVGHGEHCGVQTGSFVFSSSLTFSTTIPLSTAFAMS